MKLRNPLKIPGRKRATYFDEVTAFLAGKFEWDDTTRGICRRHLASYDDGFPAWFEFICDDPRSALWRLKASSADKPWGLRVGFYGRDHYANHHAEDLSFQLGEIRRRLT